MKLLTFILALGVLLVSVNPAWAERAGKTVKNEAKECKDKCCQKEQSCEDNRQSDKRNCSNEASSCESCLSCSCCFFGFISRGSFTPIKFGSGTDFFPLESCGPLFTFHADCFRPPEAV